MDLDKVYNAKLKEVEKYIGINRNDLSREELVKYEYNYSELKEEIEILEKYLKRIDFKEKVK